MLVDRMLRFLGFEPSTDDAARRRIDRELRFYRERAQDTRDRTQDSRDRTQDTRDRTQDDRERHMVDGA
jgi:hypothetical protein